MIETVGLVAAVEAADAAVKAANVELVGYESAKGGGMMTVKLQGEVGAMKAAVAAGEMAASRVNRVIATKVIARPGEGIDGLVGSVDTIGRPADPEPKAEAKPAEAPKPEPVPEKAPEKAAAPTAAKPATEAAPAKKTEEVKKTPARQPRKPATTAH
ncbi:BMC domain-containing protein [Aliiruegeria haliotis]|uniref:BMC domain-containing protein n=1 Tax=Aliiruegeria haliotis TaxID=1280846 RepID=UPI002481B8BE|nr:BMC domain-containing protein [Aliiruegeria haliotis]